MDDATKQGSTSEDLQAGEVFANEVESVISSSGRVPPRKFNSLKFQFQSAVNKMK